MKQVKVRWDVNRSLSFHFYLTYLISGPYFIIEALSPRLVPKEDSGLYVMRYQVALDARETAAACHHAASRVLRDVVGQQQRRAVEHHYAVVVAVDLVGVDLAEAALDDEDAFGPGVVDPVAQDDRIRRALPAEGDVRLEVHVHIILLDVSRGRLREQDALVEVAENAVLFEDGRRPLYYLYAGQAVRAYLKVLFEPGMIILASN